MAVYSGTPTNNATFELGDRNGKRVAVVRNLTLTLSSQGGATNTIGAVALGFKTTSIQKVIFVNYTDGSLQNRGIDVWTDGTNILLGDPQVGTDADRCEPVDLTGTLVIEVTGQPV